MKKKILFCLLGLVLLFTITGCGGNNEEVVTDTVVGKYELKELVYNGRSYDKDGVRELNIVVTMEFNSEGEFIKILNGVSKNYTYDSTTITDGVAIYPYTYENGILNVEMDSMKYTMEKVN